MDLALRDVFLRELTLLPISDGSRFAIAPTVYRTVIVEPKFCCKCQGCVSRHVKWTNEGWCQVVLSVVRVTYRLSPLSFASKHAAALARLLQAPPEIQGTVLAAIATIASDQPVSRLYTFFVRCLDV